MNYNFDEIRNNHLAENFALTYGGTNEIEKARKAEPIGTIKQMGGREMIKTANGWRAHTKSSASRTKEHLEKNPSANHKDEHLEKFSKETPEKELRRVIKESTDPRLREHAQKELTRRKEHETGDITKHPQYTKSDYDYLKGKGWDDSKIKARWDEEHGKGEKPVNHTAKDSKAFQDPEGRSIKEQKAAHTAVKDKLDLKGQNPYSKGQSVSYKTSDRFDNEWVEHTKVVANHPSGHVLLENGAKMHHTELQKKEHEHKRNATKGIPKRQ